MLEPMEDCRLVVNDYQKEALKTAIYPQEFKIIYPALGLAGEAGEVADKVKKLIRDDNGVLSEERRKALMYELGDVAWYLAALAKDLGYDLEEVFGRNLVKVQSRKKRNKLKGNGDNR